VTFARTEFGYNLYLDPGDELIRCLIQFAREQEVDAAVLSGAGVVAEVELDAGSGDAREQRRRLLTEPLRTRALGGTLRLVDGEPLPQVHGSFARDDSTVVDGLVYQAVCAHSVRVAVRVAAEPPAGTPTGTPARARQERHSKSGADR
jgi:predicted DNA-binding protein with PD1-like motif